MSQAKETYKYQPHGPWVVSGGKQWCFSCGLVALNNKATQFCLDKGCLYDLHSGYQAAMKRFAGKSKEKS